VYVTGSTRSSHQTSHHVPCLAVRPTEGWEGRSTPATERKAQGDLTSVYKYLMGGSEEVRARIFAVVPTGRTKSKGHNLNHMEIHLNTRKLFFLFFLFHFFFFYCEHDQTLAQDGQRGCGVSNLGNIPNMTLLSPGKPCSSWLCSVREQVGPEKLQRSKQFCDSVIL